MRLTKAAWLLVQRLGQETAELALCRDRRCARYHFTLRGEPGDVVRDSTLDALDGAGLLQRSRTAQPVYTLNDTGRRMLRERMIDEAFAEEDGAPVRQGMTVTPRGTEGIG